MDESFDYRDYLPCKTNDPDSTKDWDIEYEDSFINNGIKYFVVDLTCKTNLVLLQGRVVNGKICVRDRHGNIMNYDQCAIFSRNIYNPKKRVVK